MYSLTVENARGEKLELTHNPAFVVVSHDGFDPPDSVVNVTELAGMDGSTFNSAKLDNRQLTITLAINGPAEENRLTLYKYIRQKSPTKFYYKTESRDVFCTGYIQSVQVNFFDKKEIIQISAICPNPYLIGAEENETAFSYVTPLFEFPFTIENPVPFSELVNVTEQTIHNGGDLETGAIITLHAIGAVENPSITNADTGETIEIAAEMSEGDTITINTRRGEKGITLTSGGVTSNIIGYMSADSVLFQFPPGDTAVVLDADTGASNIVVYVNIEEHFGGV